MENKEAQHRQFVQSTITRMNTNSFQVKGMCITIVAAFLAIYASNEQDLFLIIPIPIVLLFWLLDTYYLQTERKFIGIYKDICGLTPEKKIKTKKVFSMNIKQYTGGNYRFWKVLSSPTILPLYLLIILGLILSYVILCSY